MCDPIGVIVARFQVPELHLGHLHLIGTVQTHHKDMLFVLGDHDGLPTAKDPLPYAVREAMLRAIYPNAKIARLKDMPSDEIWCSHLNKIIDDHARGRGAILYGSRDSFIKHYRGPYRTIEVPELPGFSGTAARAQDMSTMCSSATFRAGIVHAQTLRLPVSYQAVDIAILNDDHTQVLLGYKKQDGDKWRFIGGFVDPEDPSLEAAARREAREEAGDIEISDPKYIGSFRIDDHRYRNGNDKIMSAFFAATFTYGRIAPEDELDNIAWYPVTQLLNIIAPSHKRLAQALLNHINPINP